MIIDTFWQTNDIYTESKFAKMTRRTILRISLVILNISYSVFVGVLVSTYFSDKVGGVAEVGAFFFAMMIYRAVRIISADRLKLKDSEKIVILDIWKYAAILFFLTSVLGFFISGYKFEIIYLTSSICVIGATTLTISTMQRISDSRAKRVDSGIERIFK